jgi:hypothetical protein
MRYHRSTMVLRGRVSAPAAALSGSLFLKPPALPEDTYTLNPRRARRDASTNEPTAFEAVLLIKPPALRGVVRLKACLARGVKVLSRHTLSGL